MYGLERRTQMNLRLRIETPLGRHQNRSCLPGPGGARKQPTYWPCDVRCTGGVTLVWAFVRNLRTWFAMVREKAQAEAPRGQKYRCAGSGSDCPIVVTKRGNSRGAKGAGDPGRDRNGSTGDRRLCQEDARASCCTKDEGRSFEAALQREASNSHKLLQSKAAVVNVMVKRRG